MRDVRPRSKLAGAAIAAVSTALFAPHIRGDALLRMSMGYLGIGIIIAVMIAAVPSYFMGQAGPSGTLLDGYGRLISQPPEFMRQFIDQWRGPFWHVFDMLMFWSGILIGTGLALFGFKTQHSGAQDIGQLPKVQFDRGEPLGPPLDRRPVSARQDRHRRSKDDAQTLSSPQDELRLVKPLYRSVSLDALAECARSLEVHDGRPVAFSTHHIVDWNPAQPGKYDTHPADPRFPAGVDLDATRGHAPACLVKILYPAEGIGMWKVACLRCPQSAFITAAGRRDDPRSIKMMCLEQKGEGDESPGTRNSAPQGPSSAPRALRAFAPPSSKQPYGSPQRQDEIEYDAMKQAFEGIEPTEK